MANLYLVIKVVIVREMGSEAPKNVVIHVTGFKKFNVFATNPTETLVSNLKSYVEKTGLPPGVSLGSCTILETAGDGALDTLKKVLEASVSSENKSGTTEVVWVRLIFILLPIFFCFYSQAFNTCRKKTRSQVDNCDLFYVYISLYSR